MIPRVLNLTVRRGMRIVIDSGERTVSYGQGEQSHRNAGVLTQAEVAKIMTDRGYPMSAGAVGHTERRALRKLAAHPAIVELAEGLGLVDDSSPPE